MAVRGVPPSGGGGLGSKGRSHHSRSGTWMHFVLRAILVSPLTSLLCMNWDCVGEIWRLASLAVKHITQGPDWEGGFTYDCYRNTQTTRAKRFLFTGSLASYSFCPCVVLDDMCCSEFVRIGLLSAPRVLQTSINFHLLPKEGFSSVR